MTHQTVKCWESQKRNVKKNVVIKLRNHEAGHTGGLWHPWSTLNTVQDIKQGAEGVTDKMIRGNLMNSDKNTKKANRSHTGTNVTKGQLKSIDKLVRKQQ